MILYRQIANEVHSKFQSDEHERGLNNQSSKSYWFLVCLHGTYYQS